MRLAQKISEYKWLIAILILAAILRFFKLGKIPAGLTWDEAAIGYNGYAIVHTRRDEWLERLPVSFKSFGDYKAPLAIYLNGIFTFIFGLNPWAVRLPFVLSGIMTILGVYFLTKELLKYFSVTTSLEHHNLGLIASLILATSPWHLHFTRAGFESGLALTFIIWGNLFLFKFLQTNTCQLFTRWPKKLWLEKLFLIMSSSICFIGALYTYHSSKIFIPLLGLFILIFTFKDCWQQKKYILISGLMSLLLLKPLIYDSLFGQGLTRSDTLIFSLGWPLLPTLWLIFKNILTHLSPKFLILGQVSTLRHGTGVIGVLLPTTYLFAILGLIKNKINKFNKFKIFILVWILIGLLPAALGKLIPQANRSLLSLPGFIWLAIYGIDQIWGHLKAAQRKILVFISILIYLISFGFYLFIYYGQFIGDSSSEYLSGYLEAFAVAQQYEKGENGKDKKSTIIFTNDYGQPYIYALFAKKMNPIWYQGGSLNNYFFTDNINQSDLEKKDVLIVASKDDDIPEEKVDEIIYDSDGDIRFKLYAQ